MNEFFFEERGIAYRKNDFHADRLTLVFVHGLSGSASAWFQYEKIFREKYNLLTFDLRGHGKSVKPEKYEDYELEHSADDLYELTKYLHIEKCVLVSHSYGSLVALEFLHAHQEKVSVVIFLSPTAFLKQTKWYSLIKILGGGFVALFRTFPFHPHIRGRVDYIPYKNTGDWNVRRILRDIRMTTIRVYLYCITHAYAKNYDGVWGKVSVPALTMHGTEDSIIPMEHAVQLAKEIPGSKLILLEQANHVIVLNNTQEVSENIEVFSS